MPEEVATERFEGFADAESAAPSAPPAADLGPDVEGAAAAAAATSSSGPSSSSPAAKDDDKVGGFIIRSLWSGVDILLEVLPFSLPCQSELHG